MKKILLSFISVSLLILSVFILNGCADNSSSGTEDNSSKESDFSLPEGVTVPWDDPDAKQPKDYTWEEFEELSMEEADAFIASFDSEEEFNKWAESAMEDKE